MQIVVLGMHRSGTSCVTGLLHMFGAYSGSPEIMTPTTDQNPKGFWERRDVRAACDALLERADADWWKLSAFSLDGTRDELTSEARDRFSPILRELDQHEPWVLKEPRLCLLFPLLRPLLRAPVCVHVHRDPVEVAQSLRQRNGFGLGFGLALWEVYSLSAFAASRGLPRVLVSYADLIANPAEAAAKLHAELVGLGVAGISLPDGDAIADFLDRSLHRQRSRAELRPEHLNRSQLRLAASIESGAILAAETLAPLSEGAAQVLREYEGVSARFDALAREVAGFRSELRHRGDQIQSIRELNTAQRKTIDKRDRRMASLSSEVSALRHSISWKITAPLRAVYDALGLERWARSLPALAPHSDKSLLPPVPSPEVARAPTIIVTVYNALEHTRRCIDSVLRHTRGKYSLVLMDDASDDPRIDPCLRSYANDHQHVHHIRNSENLGYTRTINIGCRKYPTDIVLLNSDTVVSPLWLELLRESAYRSDRIGTVTAVSNNAGAFSIPKVNQKNELPPGYTIERYSEMVRDLAARDLPEVPTGNGFCVYIKRAVFEKIGFFDEESFPRGYGEENDFSMRARKAGFSSVIDDGVFIEHHRSASFGSGREALVKHGKRALARLHPEYQELVDRFMREHPLVPLGARIEQVLGGEPMRLRDRGDGHNEGQSSEAERAVSGAVLFVIHDGAGGSLLTNQDLVGALAGRLRCYVLLCSLQRWRLLDPETGNEVRSFEFETRWRVQDATDSARLAAIRSICAEFGVSVAHVRSLIASGPEILPCLKEQGVKVVFSFHDFFTICPTIQLLDEREVYCGGHCTEGEGSCRLAKNWFSPIPSLKHGYVYQWRQRTRTGLRHCDAFITTSNAAKQVILDFFPGSVGDRLQLIEHGHDLAPGAVVRVPPGRDRVRVVAMGALGPSKGTSLLRKLFALNADPQKGGVFEFHILGNVDGTLARPAPGVVQHGPYEREDLPKLLAEIAPSFSLITSIWPETYCHTMTESWLLGIPVLASDIGTLRERVLAHGGGWLLDYRDPVAWFQRMLEISRDEEDYARRCEEVDAVRIRSVDEMADDYLRLYAALSPPTDPEPSRTP